MLIISTNRANENMIKFYLWMLLGIRERFEALCDKRLPWNGITMMKDVSLAKMGVTGQRLYNKAQDFVYDDVLFQYCVHPQVRNAMIATTSARSF